MQLRQEQNRMKGLEVRVPSAHTSLVRVSVSTSQMGKHRDSWDIGRVWKGFALVVGNY